MKYNTAWVDLRFTCRSNFYDKRRETDYVLALIVFIVYFGVMLTQVTKDLDNENRVNARNRVFGSLLKYGASNTTQRPGIG